MKVVPGALPFGLAVTISAGAVNTPTFFPKDLASARLACFWQATLRECARLRLPCLLPASLSAGGVLLPPLSPATPGAPIEVRICPRGGGLASLDCTLAGAFPRTRPILITCDKANATPRARRAARRAVFTALPASSSSDEGGCEIVCARACRCVGDGATLKVCL